MSRILHPFFYVLVPDNWEKRNVVSFKQFLKMEVGHHYENSILDCEIVKKEESYTDLIILKIINL